MSQLSSADSLQSLNLEWVFDPNRIDHLPVEKQLTFYRSRDLRHSKAFRFGTSVCGQPAGRTRRIVIGSCCRDVDTQFRPAVTSSDSYKRNAVHGSQCGNIAYASNNTDCDEVLMNYKNWTQRLHNVRNIFNDLGLSDEWLLWKPDKSEMEKRVLHQLLQEKKNLKHCSLPPDQSVDVDGRLPDVLPVIHRPSPMAVRIIEQFLYENHIRLIDLFQEVDKNKDWVITREDFKLAIKNSGMPLSDADIDELLLVYDEASTGRLDYRDLARSLALWRREKKLTKTLYRTSGNTTPDVNTKSMPDNSQSDVNNRSSQLCPPTTDCTPEQLVLKSHESIVDSLHCDRHLLQLRKQSDGLNTAAGEYTTTTVKSGDHCAASTLTAGDHAASINEFRKQQLRIYMDLCRTCSERGVVLSHRLLQAALLYPADIPHDVVKRSIRHRAGNLVSASASALTSNISPPASTSPRPTAAGHRHLQSRSRCHAVNSDVALSQTYTSRRRRTNCRVDCWLTFDDYLRLVRDLPASSGERRTSDDNAVWCNRLVDKLVHVTSSEVGYRPSESIFAHVATHTRRSGLAAWPTNASGYVQYGSIE